MKTTGATVAITGTRDRLRAWIAHHRRVCIGTLRELLESPLSSLMTWLVIGIALALPAILTVFLQNVSALSGDWGGEPRLSVYLVQTAGTAEARALADTLERQGDVSETRFISSEQALVDFRNRSGFGDVLASLDRNPLPHVIEVVPVTADPLELGSLVARIEADNLVESVAVDLAWLERLYALLQFAKRLVTALGIVLALGVLLIMGNTIRLSIENRRQEIEVIKLVGGTDGFVRRPFLYLGFWYGLGGALFALVLLEASLLFLSSPVEMLAQSYQDDYALSGPGLMGILLLLLLGAFLGVAGAVLAVSRHLRDIEPR